MILMDTSRPIRNKHLCCLGGWGCCVTFVYVLQAVAAKVEQLEVFGQQEVFGPEMFDAVPRQIHLHDVRLQVSWDVIQICKDRTNKHKSGKSKVLPRE